MNEGKHKYEKPVFFSVLILAIVGFSLGGYFYYGIASSIVQNTADLENKILELEDRNIVLTKTLKTEQQKNESFSAQIGQIAGTVGRLDKLSKTDEELLQKYSKIYFLNENYVPSLLAPIPADFIFEAGKKVQIHSKVLPFLESLIKAAESEGVSLKIISGFRSFGDQSSLKSSYSVTYGTGANKFSADQGYSEHQLGTTIDFTTETLGLNFTNFSKTESYEWLVNNAYKYGFIISYPEGNSFYQFEPWHWRFVGKRLAERLREEKQNFYDLDQRKIDAYLINIFD